MAFYVFYWTKNQGATFLYCSVGGRWISKIGQEVSLLSYVNFLDNFDFSGEFMAMAFQDGRDHINEWSLWSARFIRPSRFSTYPDN
ncbi:hypothetical protein DN53_04600 [Flagellimonas olearia]|uniref:Uncharacterized protein n=1 Tax=Flagellimonas olearia TaxID=552546 RepID=A0A444VS85_9FLAO|nr:hypothetical protein DN53_04600 [Allomuricauda olearia]